MITEHRHVENYKKKWLLLYHVCTWAAAKFSASSFLLVAGKNTMLSMVWISSSCTTHLISKAANKRCSWTSVGRTDKLPSEHTHTHRKRSQSIFEWSSRLTRWSPAPGAVLTHARSRAVLTVPAVLNRNPVSAADGVLVITTGLNIHWLLRNGVLRAKWACELMQLYIDTVLKITQNKPPSPHQLFVWQTLCCQVVSVCSCWPPC